MRNKKLKISVMAILVVTIISTLLITNHTYTEATPNIPSKSVSLNAKNVTIAVGGIVDLNETMKPLNSTDTVKWTSGNKDIATVTAQGVVTGISDGDTEITITTSNGKSAKCDITVVKQLTDEEVVGLIKDNTIDEVAVRGIVEDNTLSESDVKTLISDATKNISYGSSNSTYTITQGEFNAMYENMLNTTTVTDGTSVPCYPVGEFDWVISDISNSTGSAITAHIISMNATIINNDFATISQSLQKGKSYKKYSINITVSGRFEASEPTSDAETKYIVLSALSNNIDVGLYSAYTQNNPDGTFYFVLQKDTNSPVDEIVFSSMACGYN